MGSDLEPDDLPDSEYQQIEAAETRAGGSPGYEYDAKMPGVRDFGVGSRPRWIEEQLARAHADDPAEQTHAGSRRSSFLRRIFGR